MIEIKEGTKTIYLTEKAYEKYMEAKKQRKTNIGDITCSGASSVGLAFDEEDYNRIFRKGGQKDLTNATNLGTINNDEKEQTTGETNHD